MKKIRKIGAFTLALVMCFALASTAFAEDGDQAGTGEYSYTVTVDAEKNPSLDDLSGFVFEAYQIFSGTYSEDTQTLGDIQWGSGIDQSKLSANADAIAKALNTSADALQDSDGSLSAAKVAEALSGYKSDTKEAKAFASAIWACLSTEVTATATTDENGEATLKGLDAGYYLIDNSKIPDNGAYTDDILVLVPRDDKGAAKEETPSSDKVIGDNDTTDTDPEYNESTHAGLDSEDLGRITASTVDAEGNVADYCIGDEVPYAITGTLPGDYAEYKYYKVVFHDKLNDVLSLNEDSFVITIDENKYTVEYDGNNFTVNDSNNQSVDWITITLNPDDGDTFDITIVLKYWDEGTDTVTENVTVTSDSTIKVEYTATLTSAANVETAYENDMKMEFSNNPNATQDGYTGFTPEKKVYVFTFGMNIVKVDGSTLQYGEITDETTLLPGAEFVLQNADDQYLAIYTVDANGTETLVTDSRNLHPSDENTSYVVEWVDSENEATKLISDDNGNISIVGIDEGTYTLTETKAPAGYNTPDQAFTVTIAATYKNNGAEIDEITVTVNDETVSTEGNEIVVENNQGSQLPSTGGIGTTIFYVVGGVLVVGALVLLVSKRRMAKQGQ